MQKSIRLFVLLSLFVACLPGFGWAISVTLNLNGGTWSTAPSGVGPTANYTFTVATGQLYSAGTPGWNWASPTKSGKAFRGWNTNANGSGNYFGPNALVQSTANQILYAVWVDEEYKPSSLSICPGGTTTLCASSNFASWSWSPAAGLSSTTARCPTLTANSMPGNNVVYTCTYGPSTTTGIVYNYDFSMGNVGFTSQYDYMADDPNTNGELGPERRYTVTSCWNRVHTQLDPTCILKDHTTGSASGLMMLVNGGKTEEAVGDRVWEQTVAVYPNTMYEISMWVAAAHYPTYSGYPESVLAPAKLQFYLNGSPVGQLKTIDSYYWQKISVTWNSGNNYTATISIRDFCTEAQGNDFAIDDIQVTAQNQPLTYTVTRRADFSAGSIATTGQTICSGGTVNTISTDNASGGNNDISYQWYHNGEAINGATAATYTPTEYSTQVGTHTFTRKAKDTECNPTLTNSAGSWVLKVNPLPVASISDVSVVCPNNVATVVGSVSSTTPNYTYNWGGGLMLSTQSATTSATTHQVTATVPAAPCIATYTVTLKVTDGNGCESNQAEKSVSVSMDDAITITGGVTQGQATCVNNLTPPHQITPSVMPTVKDACGNELTFVGNPVVSVLPECEGTVTYTYTYKDCAEHTYDWVYTYTIEREDFTMPDNAGTTVACIAQATEPTPPTVKDNCNNTLTPGAAVAGGTYDGCEGTKTYTFTYTDCEGNSHDWTYTYTILPPVLTFTNNGLADIENVNNCYSPNYVSQLKTDAQVKAMYSSNCDRTIVVEHDDEVEKSDDCDWKITRTFTITDGCNEESKTQSISGGDNTPPTFTAPEAVTVCRNADNTYDISTAATGTVEDAEDNCSTPTIEYSDADPVVKPNGTQTIVRTWRVTDACGKYTEHQQTITVNPLPTITATPSTQNVTYGNAITPVVLSSTYSNVVAPTLPDGLTYNSTTQTISGELPAGDYVFTVNAVNDISAECGSAEQNVEIHVQKKALLITLDSTKIYDGTPFSVTYNQLYYDGLVNGDVMTAGTITTDDYWVGNYTCTDGFFAGMYADFKAIQSGFGPESVTKNYDVRFDVVLRIVVRPLEITAKSDSKVFDNTPLTNSGYDFTNGTSLAATDAASVTVEGSQLYVGSSNNVVTAQQIMHVAEPRDVTACYDITYQKGKLTVTPIEDNFYCPDMVTIILPVGVSEMTVTTEQTGVATLVPAVSGTYVTNNLDELNPMSAEVGTYTVIWKLYDAEGHFMTSCEQIVKIQYETCLGVNGYDGHDYDAVRIGTQCWLTENLRNTIDAQGHGINTYHAYNDDPDNKDKFGYLYSWYSAVGVEEGDNAADLASKMKIGADGQPYLQGICPTGWAVPSRNDFEILNNYVSDVSYLKDPDPQYWTVGVQAQDPGSGFNERGSGRFNSATGRYEDLLTNAFYWRSDDTSNTSTVGAAEINYYCSTFTFPPASKTDLHSVRCIKKQ